MVSADVRALRSAPWILVAAGVAALVGFAFAALAAHPPHGARFLAPLVVIVVGLGTAAVAALLVARPWSGLLAWMLLLPLFDAARMGLSVGSWQLLVTTPFVAALAAGWLLNRRPAGAEERRLAGLTVVQWGWAFAAVAIAIAALSTAAAANVSRAVPIFLNGFAEPVLLGALALSLRPSRRQALALALALSVAIVMATAINIVALLPHIHSFNDLSTQRVLLARHTFYNVGIYGDVLVMVLPMLLALAAVWERRRLPGWLTVLLILGLALCLAGLYLTFSKSAWIGALIVLPLLLLLVGPASKKARLYILAGAVVASALVLPYPSAILKLISPGTAGAYDSIVSGVQIRQTTFNADTPEGEVSVTERLYATEAGIRAALDHPLLGLGPGGFGPAYNNGPYKNPKSTRPLDSPHDLPVDLAAELGLPEAGLVLLAFLAAGLAAWSLYRQHDAETSMLGAAWGCGILGFLIVATLFGVDLYRPNRLMDADVLIASLLVAVPLALRASPLGRDRLETAAAAG